MVLGRTRELQATQDATILSMATPAETRDPETGYHIQRTQAYVRSLALKLREHARFRDELDDQVIGLLFKSAPLHDIGKVGVPDRILRKPARLTPEEYEEMKRHVIYGYERSSQPRSSWLAPGSHQLRRRSAATPARS